MACRGRPSLSWCRAGSRSAAWRSTCGSTRSDPVTSSTEVAFGADPATVTTGPSPLLTAVLLAGLFVASGFLAFWIGYSHHPRMKAYRHLRTQLVQQRASATAADQAAQAAEGLLANARNEQQRARQRAAGAELSVNAEIAELKELARLHLAGLLGEPSSTNAVTTARAPRTAPLPVRPRRFSDALPHVNGVPAADR